MDSNSWAARLSSASKRYQSALQSRSGMKWDSFDAEMLMGFEEIEMDDDIRGEYPCPFCSDYFDIVGLCCHIDDEHPVEAKNGVKFYFVLYNYSVMNEILKLYWSDKDVQLRHHLTHYMQRKRKSRKAGSHSTLSFLRRELREGNLQSLFGGSSCIPSSNNAAPDPLLSSFILPMSEDYESVPSHSSAEATLIKKNTTGSISERKVQQPPMSIKDKEEKAKRSDFVQGLLLSVMFDDNL
ncbi:hypothetical protein DH2020_047228 [Rehmannia glutinosa]|uniref:Uncharacterized protein n=1 Tax=Rehmannia glutinosa TaxID=99300 RepID=A0ABR0UAM4_REHGL